MKKVAVIGGGITGLTAAFQLRQAGLAPLIFEAGESPGGVVQTREIEGYRIELGPNSLQESPEQVTELIAALGLSDQVVEANPEAKKRYVVRDERLIPVPSSPRGLLRSPILSWRGKLQLLKEPFRRPAPAEVEESLADFARRRLGEEVLDYLVNPFIAGIYAGDPERLSAQHALPQLFAMEKEHGSLFRAMKAPGHGRAPGGKQGGRSRRLISFRAGLGALTGALADRLRQSIYLETTAETITAREGKWELVASRHGRSLRDTYDAVVLALPPDALAGISFETEADPESLKTLRDIPHPPVTSISLGFRREQVSHPLDGFGMLIPEKERRQTLGTLFASTLFPGRAPEDHVLLTSFIGGTRQPEVTENPEKGLLRILLEDLRPLLGIWGDPAFVFIHPWPRAIPQYEVGHGKFLRAIEEFEERNPGLFVAGTARDGISLGHCAASGFRHAGRARKYLS